MKKTIGLTLLLLLFCLPTQAEEESTYPPVYHVLKTLFPQQHHAWLSLLETTNIIEQIPTTQTDPVQVLDTLNAKLQQNWLRQAGTERWHLTDDNLCQQQKNSILESFNALHLYDEKSPALKEYDSVFLMGGIQPRVELRLDYLLSLWKQGVRFKHLYVLSGQRQLMPEREPIFTELQASGIESNEGNMMERIVSRRLKTDYPVTIIYVEAPTPKYASRASTESTISKWKALYGMHSANSKQDKKLLVISSQPFISYQGAVAARVLSDDFKVEFLSSTNHYYHLANGYQIDIVGPKGNPTPLTIGLDNLARDIYVMLPWLKQQLTNDKKIEKKT